MASTAVRLVIDDPENFHLLTTDMKEQIIKGGIATVNVQAALTRKKAIENIKDDFTLRNNFTTSQVQFTQMPQGRYALSAIHSTVGITEKAGYMARQELGGPHKPSGGGTKLAIPMNKARGGNRGSPVLKPLYLTRLKNKTFVISFEHSLKPRSRLVAAAYLAFVKRGSLRYNNQLFSVNNFEKREDKISFKMEHLYDFSKEETMTPAVKWLERAMLEVSKDSENIFISQMKKLGM
jgi:hypothetical protein